METKRTKLWRRKQCFRVFKARMIYYASFEREYLTADGRHVPLHWFELAKTHWAQVYRSTGTPAQGGLSVAGRCRCLTKELDMIAC